MDFAALGVIGAFVASITGAALGILARRDQRRSAAEAKAQSSQAMAAAAKAEERSVAIVELEKGMELLGVMVDRAVKRAEDCERREHDLLQRVAALERVAGLA